MKLNLECVRELLLYAEENLSYKNNSITVNNLKIKDYSEEELLYTAEKLNEANYIKCIIGYGYELPMIVIVDIYFQGHQFINNIRDDKVFTKTKSILSGFKSVSIELFSETASKVITALINQQINS